MTDLEGSGGGFDLELATASLLADGKDVHMLLKVLVKELAGALGNRLQVQRKGGFLHRSEEIESVDLEIGKDRFHAAVGGPGVQCSIGHASGGIRIRSEEVDMNDWLRRLLGSLQAEADHNQTARLALENIVIGGPA